MSLRAQIYQNSRLLCHCRPRPKYIKTNSGPKYIKTNSKIYQNSRRLCRCRPQICLNSVHLFVNDTESPPFVDSATLRRLGWLKNNIFLWVRPVWTFLENWVMWNLDGRPHCLSSSRPRVLSPGQCFNSFDKNWYYNRIFMIIVMMMSMENLHWRLCWPPPAQFEPLPQLGGLHTCCSSLWVSNVKTSTETNFKMILEVVVEPGGVTLGLCCAFSQEWK